jgi:glycosyltransferase involved in cell wall biosynthesis
MYGGYSYIDRRYVPSEDDFIVLIWVKGKAKVEKLAEAVASESSVGTWTKIKTMNEKVFKEYRARIFKIIKVTEKSGFVYIAYPWEHFDQKNVLQFYAGVLGNLFGLKELEECYILDINFPKKYQKQFNGPEFGLNGCLPNKMFEYLMAEIPVIVSNLYEMRRLVEKNNIGAVAKENTPQGLKKAIEEAVNLDKEELKANIQKIKKIYNWEEQEKVLLKVYRDLNAN